MQLEDWLEKKTPEDLITIMLDALDLMQQFNSRSRTYCIVVAAGGTATENEDGSYTYSIPHPVPDTHTEVVMYDM